MAKTARKTRKAKRRRRLAKSARRVSTQKLGQPRQKRSSPKTTATRALARADAALETLEVTLELRDVSDRSIRDPETFFTFRRLSDHRQIGDQLQLELLGAPAVFNLPVATGEVVVCEIDPKRFRFVQSPVFFRSPGPPITRRSQLFREPKEWTPRFTRWNDLPAAFGGLKRVLSVSPRITLFKEADPIAELLVEATYDGMSGEDVILAKTALLNTYFRLSHASEPVSANRSWFSFVSRLVAIGRERFLAFVDPEMETLVRQIHTHIDQFSADYERTPAENHRGNVPAALQNRIANMISIKSTHSKGNFQLTLTHLSNPDEVLLDTDIDEHGDLLGHFLDLFKHKITGGTHPHDVHELLVLQEGQTPGFDLGYRLVPLVS
jgi:hypothetical protein